VNGTDVERDIGWLCTSDKIYSQGVASNGKHILFVFHHEIEHFRNCCNPPKCRRNTDILLVL